MRKETTRLIALGRLHHDLQMLFFSFLSNDPTANQPSISKATGFTQKTTQGVAGDADIHPHPRFFLFQTE